MKIYDNIMDYAKDVAKAVVLANAWQGIEMLIRGAKGCKSTDAETKLAAIVKYYDSTSETIAETTKQLDEVEV